MFHFLCVWLGIFWEFWEEKTNKDEKIESLPVCHERWTRRRRSCRSSRLSSIGRKSTLYDAERRDTTPWVCRSSWLSWRQSLSTLSYTNWSCTSSRMGCQSFNSFSWRPEDFDDNEVTSNHEDSRDDEHQNEVIEGDVELDIIITSIKAVENCDFRLIVIVSNLVNTLLMHP